MSDNSFNKIITIYEENLKAIQAGRAEPSLIDGLMVDVYGQQMPIKQVANVSAPEVNMLLCQPWDQNNAGAIEKALREADISMSVSSEGGVIRAVLPELTAERREELVKLVSRKKEDIRIQVRQTRENMLKDLKAKDLSDDDEAKEKDNIDKEVAEANKTIDELTAQKEEALRKV